VKRNHRDLRAWKQAIELVSAVYAVTANFPETERYGLTSQMRRAAVSVPADIAEGAARSGPREFMHFLSITSGGSRSELDTLFELPAKLGYVADVKGAQAQIDNVAGLIMCLSASLKRRP
jgi:four helix bundle protein